MTICPKCGKEMSECDGGPDGYDDDITYTNDICFECEIMLHGWFDMWYNYNRDFYGKYDYKGFKTSLELLNYINKKILEDVVLLNILKG